ANLRPGNWRKPEKEVEAAKGEPDRSEEEQEQDQLADMRWVYGHPKTQDRTQGHRVCRGWMDDDPKGFMTAKTQLEAKAKAAEPASGKPDGPPPLDEGEERVRAMIDKLLGDMERREAEENAQEATRLMARPDGRKVAVSLQRALASAMEREKRLREKLDELREGEPKVAARRKINS